MPVRSCVGFATLELKPPPKGGPKPETPKPEVKPDGRDRMRKKLAAKQGARTICCTAIVKNESANMVRLLDSLKSILDFICITDTGSTDDTVAVIEQWGVAHKIPTTVCVSPFVDFAVSRTQSVINARQTYPMANYLLLTDADFVWELKNFKTTQLIHESHMVVQRNSEDRYNNIRFLKNNIDWKCVGTTHEYWTLDEDLEFTGYTRQASVALKGIEINDIGDGGAKDDKFPRDERLLLAGLANPKVKDHLKRRYWFYLGETLKNQSKFYQAVEAYLTRIQLGGFPEEVYWATMQLGTCYKKIGYNLLYCAKLYTNQHLTRKQIKTITTYSPANDQPTVLYERAMKAFKLAGDYFLAAWHKREGRAEALYYYVEMLRELRFVDKGYKYALKGKKIAYPHNDGLFVNVLVHTYLFDYEISILASHLTDLPDWRQIGRAACHKLLTLPGVAEQHRNLTIGNARFYE